MDIAKPQGGVRPQIPQLCISVSASPQFDEGSQPVGYASAAATIGELVIPAARLDHYFAPHRTVIIRMVIPRYQARRVFDLKA